MVAAALKTLNKEQKKKTQTQTIVWHIKNMKERVLDRL